MKEILDALVEAIRQQALALQSVADEVTELKRTLARRDSELADELKRQIDAIAMQTVADRVTTLQRTLATHESGLAGELKTQAEAEQEKNRATVYELQVRVAKAKEAISESPNGTAPAGKKRTPKKRAPQARKAKNAASRRRV